MSRKIEDIKNIHYNNKNEIQFEYGGQVHHHSMNSLKEMFVNYWNLIDRIDKAIELGEKQLLSNSNYTGYTDEMCLKDLLEILKGESFK